MSQLLERALQEIGKSGDMESAMNVVEELQKEFDRVRAALERELAGTAAV